MAETVKRRRYWFLPLLFLAFLPLTIRHPLAPKKLPPSAPRTVSLPTVKTISAAPSVEAETEVEKLTRWIHEDNICEADGSYRIKPDFFVGKEEVVYPAIAEAAGEKIAPCLKSLWEKNWEKALKIARRNSGEDCRFVEALLLTHQWQTWSATPPNIPTDKIRAREIFTELARSHPDNGIYPFFLLSLSENPEPAFRDFLNAKHFTNPILSARRHLSELIRENTASWIMSANAFGNESQPILGASVRVAHRLAKDGSFPAEFEEWANRLLNTMKEMDELDLHQPAVDTGEINSLVGIAQAGWKENLPDLFIREKGWTKFNVRRMYGNAEVQEDPWTEADIATEQTPCRDTQEIYRRRYAYYQKKDGDLAARFRKFSR